VFFAASIVPSGLGGDAGEWPARGGGSLTDDAAVTFVGLKPGLMGGGDGSGSLPGHGVFSGTDLELAPRTPEHFAPRLTRIISRRKKQRRR